MFLVFSLVADQMQKYLHAESPSDLIAVSIFTKKKVEKLQNINENYKNW